MLKKSNESNKVLLGLVLGGVLGASAYYFMKANRSRPTPVLKKIGKTLCDVGEMIENSHLGHTVGGAVHDLEDSLPKAGDLLSTMVDWASTGIHLWKKFNK